MGRLLAQSLHFDFLDTDLEIERLEGMTISEMVEAHGWSYFRQAERDYLTSVVSKRKVVVAPGGGAVMHQDVWQQLMENSLIVWLKADVQTICERLAGDVLSNSQRPSLTGEDFLQEVQAVLSEREPLYEQGSHLVVHVKKPLDEVVAEIEKFWLEMTQ